MSIKDYDYEIEATLAKYGQEADKGVERVCGNCCYYDADYWQCNCVGTRSGDFNAKEDKGCYQHRTYAEQKRVQDAIKKFVDNVLGQKIENDRKNGTGNCAGCPFREAQNKTNESKPQVELHSLLDVMRLKKEELAFAVWEFCQWTAIGDEDGCCPANKCVDFPCQYRQEKKARCEESLANGDLDEAGMRDQREHGYYAQYCAGDQLGCWAEYYIWCCRNGYNPATGKARQDGASPQTTPA